MVVESSQAQYKGAGYNDLDLNMLGKPLYARSNASNSSLTGSTAPTTTNSSATNLNASSASLPPPPPMGVPRTRKASESAPEADQLQIKADISDSELAQQMESLLARPSNLATREFDHYCTKLRKQVPGLQQESRDIAYHALELASDGDAARAKELLVQYMLRQSGSSSWAMPLRKVVENVAS